MLKIIQANKNHLNDASYLFDLYRMFYGMPSNIPAAKHFISERFSKKDSLIFLAFKENCAVGFMQIYHSFSSVAMRPIWILNDLFVDSSARRNGCAKKMMHYLYKQAKKDKVFSIKLATAVNNNKAIALYCSLGYQLNKDFDNYSKLLK